MKLVLDLIVAGAMLCAETDGLEEKVGRKAARRERAAIAFVALAHWREDGGRLASSLKRNGFATKGCSGRPRYRARLGRLFAEVYRGKLRPPAWARRARAFATREASKRVSVSWRARGFEPIPRTGTVHVFWRRASGPAASSRSRRPGAQHSRTERR